MSVLGLVLELVFSIFVAALRTVVLREGPALALSARRSVHDAWPTLMAVAKYVVGAPRRLSSSWVPENSVIVGSAEAHPSMRWLLEFHAFIVDKLAAPFGNIGATTAIDCCLVFAMLIAGLCALELAVGMARWVIGATFRGLFAGHPVLERQPLLWFTRARKTPMLVQLLLMLWCLIVPRVVFPHEVARAAKAWSKAMWSTLVMREPTEHRLLRFNAALRSVHKAVAERDVGSLRDLRLKTKDMEARIDD